MISIRLTDAQAGALECRHLEDEEATLARVWDGNRTLRFEADEAEAVLDALTEAANAEDAQHQEDGCQYARRAAECLSRISSKVLDSIR
jgi:hypothetical protein